MYASAPAAVPAARPVATVRPSVVYTAHMCNVLAERMTSAGRRLFVTPYIDRKGDVRGASYRTRGRPSASRRGICSGPIYRGVLTDARPAVGVAVRHTQGADLSRRAVGRGGDASAPAARWLRGRLDVGWGGYRRTLADVAPARTMYRPGAASTVAVPAARPVATVRPSVV